MDKLLEDVKAFFEFHNVDKTHGYDHAVAVMNHAKRASDRVTVHVAALMHDMDDSKTLPSVDNKNARTLIRNSFVSEYEDEIIAMIKLVSCSTNGNAIDPALPEYYYIPRFCDRLEAIGHIGVCRCYQWTKYTKRPFYLDTTPRCSSQNELYMVATKSRFDNYRGKSDSFIDHIYDKLLHLSFTSNNEYLDKECRERLKYMETFVLDWGRGMWSDVALEATFG